MKSALRSCILLIMSTALPSRAADPIPRSLTVERTPAGFQINWQTGDFLQTAPSIKGPWTVVEKAVSPYSPVRTGDTAFFRTVSGFTLTTTKSGAGLGTLASTTPGVVCGADCSELYAPGTTVTLRATPDAGSTFAGWSGACNGTGDCVVIMDGVKFVTATFDAAQAANPIVNGDFEQGPLVGWAQEPAQLVFPTSNLGGATPFSGQYAAWVGFDRDGRRAARIGQRVTLPGTQPLFLNFALWIYSEELCDVPYYDAITLYINGQSVVGDDGICKSSNTDGWRKYSVDLSAIAGQSATIVFEISSADNLASVALLDDVAISAQSWGP